MQTKLIPTASVEQSRQTATYIPAFTGLRAIAAYLVFLHHYNPSPVGAFANRLFHQGYIGVSFFFVLSGFLIHHRYADDYLGRINWSWRRYLQNRFARIFPLYALLLLLTVSVKAQMGHPMPLPVVILDFMLLQGFSETYASSGIAQSWSLTVEVCFYLLAPLLFVALKRWGPLPLTVWLIGSGLLIRATSTYLAGSLDYREALHRQVPFLFFYTFFGRSFEFVLGMWLAHRWQQNRFFYIPYAMRIGLLIISSCVLWQTGISLFAATRIVLIGSEIAVYNFILPIGISLFLLGLISSNAGLRQLLSHSLLQALGRSSYAFYLIHIGVVAHGLQRAGITNRCLLFGLLVLIAHGLYSFIEKPLYQWLRTSKDQVSR
ncbi:acyltransferase [Spirosoma horti]